MWLCSWNQIDSTPCASAQRPNSSGDVDSSAGKVTPTSTDQPATDVSTGAQAPDARYRPAAIAAVAPSPATVTACAAESLRASPATRSPGRSVRIQPSVGTRPSG